MTTIIAFLLTVNTTAGPMMLGGLPTSDECYRLGALQVKGRPGSNYTCTQYTTIAPQASAGGPTTAGDYLLAK